MHSKALEEGCVSAIYIVIWVYQIELDACCSQI